MGALKILPFGGAAGMLIGLFATVRGIVEVAAKYGWLSDLALAGMMLSVLYSMGLIVMVVMCADVLRGRV